MTYKVIPGSSLWRSPKTRNLTRRPITRSHTAEERQQHPRAANNPNFFSPLTEDRSTEEEINPVGGDDLYDRLTQNYPPEEQEVIFNSPQASQTITNNDSNPNESNPNVSNPYESNPKDSSEDSNFDDSSDTDSELDYDSDPDIMEDSTTSDKKLLDYIKARHPDQAVPYQGKPTLGDKLTFRLALIGALESLPCPYTDTGYSWLVEDPATYKKRTKEDPPEAPTYPGAEDPTATKTEAKVWKYKAKRYQEYKERIEELHLTLETRFPDCLTKYKDTNGRVRRSEFFEPRQLVNTFVGSDNGVSAGHTTFVATTEKMSNLRVTPLTAKGLNNYFLQLEQQMEIANTIPIPTKVDYAFLQRTALAGIMRSDFPADKITEYEREWLASPAATDGENNTAPEIWNALKEFYNEKIELLELSSELTNRRAQAKIALNTENSIQNAVNAAIADQEKRHNEEMNTLSARFTQQTDQLKALLLTKESSQATPSVTTPSTTGSTVSDLTTISAANLLQALAANQSLQLPANTGSNALKGKWKQWNYWCYSCGVNLNHNTPGCKKSKDKCKQGHHKHSTTATFTNKQGGNTKRDHLWNKWFHPDLRIPQDTPTMPTE